MATHKTHHVDSSVGERRLRIIYDWLDNGNNKKALQEAEKVLRKQPNFHCAKVLKALALLRLGREKESSELIESVKEQTPSDESTLQAMTICYRETHKPESICEIYEAAAKMDPTNEELMTHLFMAYVRIGNYKRQQRTAMLLYKTRPKNPYYFWAVMSIVMQAYEGDSNLARSLVLPLAERMVKKFVDEDRIEAEQEVQLYIMILEMQNKYEEILRLLNGPLGAKLISPSRASDKRIQALLRLRKCVQANICLKKHLKQNLSQWSYYKDYLDSSFDLYDNANKSDTNDKEEITKNQLNDDDDNEINETADCYPSACWKFFQELQQLNIKTDRAERGPLLASLELAKRLRTRDEPIDPLIGDILTLFIDYFTFFASKPCCLADLRPYLNLIIQDNRSTELIKHFEKILDLEKDSMPRSESQMRQHQSLEQISRYLGLHNHLSEEEKIAKLEYYGRIFQYGRKFNPNSLATELGCNDPYALLSTHLLYDIWLSSGQISRLLEALTLLETSLLQSPSNFHYKLLLIRLYHQLGAANEASTNYDSLDIKHVQLDSLGWLHGSQLAICGKIHRFYQIADVTLRLFHSTNKDSLDHLTFSYKYGSFAKIHELVAFRDRLSSSHLLSMLTIDRYLYDLLVRVESKQQAFKVYSTMDFEPWLSHNWSLDKLSDNRDLSVCVHWNNHNDQLTRERSFKDDYCYLELRTWLLRLCIAMIDSDKLTNIQWNCENNISSPPSNIAPLQNGSEISNDDLDKSSNSTSSSSILKRLSSEISLVLEKIKTIPRYNFYQELISAPLDNRLSSIIEMEWTPAALQLINLAIQIRINKEDNSNNKELEEKPIILAARVISHATKMVKEKQQRKNFQNSLLYIRDTFKAILNAIEMLGLVCLTLSSLTTSSNTNNSNTFPIDDSLSLSSGNLNTNRTNASNRKQKQRKHLEKKKGASEPQNSLHTSTNNTSPLSTHVTFTSNPVQYIQEIVMESSQELDTVLNEWGNEFFLPQENIPKDINLSIEETTSLSSPSANHVTSTATSKTSNNNLPSTDSQEITPDSILIKLRQSHFTSLAELSSLLSTKIKHLANLG